MENEMKRKSNEVESEQEMEKSQLKIKMEKQEYNGNVNGNWNGELENWDEKLTRKMDMEKLQAMLQLVSLHSMAWYRKLCKSLNER